MSNLKGNFTKSKVVSDNIQISAEGKIGGMGPGNHAMNNGSSRANPVKKEKHHRHSHGQAY